MRWRSPLSFCGSLWELMTEITFSNGFWITFPCGHESNYFMTAAHYMMKVKKWKPGEKLYKAHWIIGSQFLCKMRLLALIFTHCVFNFTSEASYVYILSWQKSLKVPKNSHFWKSKSRGQTVLPDRWFLIGQKWDIFSNFQTTWNLSQKSQIGKINCISL